VDLDAMRSDGGRGKRGIEGPGSGAGDRRRLAVKLSLLAAVPLAILVVRPVAAQDNTPVITPDRLEDVQTIQADALPFPRMDHFAWRAFVALNWPSLKDPAGRGVPDRGKTLGDPGPRVWETFKARYELFQVDQEGRPAPPPPWATYEAANPCGARVDRRSKTLATFDPFMDFNQPIFAPREAGNPLVAQNGTYTRYETRLNEAHYSALALNGWSQGRNLPDRDNPARIPAGSIAVKAAWRILNAADSPAVRSRYYVVRNANVVDVARTRAARRVVCSKSDVALVGLHIVVRTKFRPQGVWSSFEHVDNVPPANSGPSREPDARDAGAPYSYFDASKPSLGLWPEYGSPATSPLSLDNPPSLAPAPMQVVRRHPINESTMKTNRAWWATPGIKGTVWENYMLVANQWPTFTRPVDPSNDGIFFPDHRRENLVNTTMETYFQDRPSSCMSCHHKVSNALGRDFVGILDSFR
jgi:hypothetical protein